MSAATRRSVAEHVAAVQTLLSECGLDPRHPARLGAENLPLTVDALTDAPAAWRERILAADVVAPSSLPGFDNSQMDGYAVRAADVAAATEAQPAALTVAPMIVAGEVGGPLPAGHAAPIMTGAPLPEGADAVIPIEHVEPTRFGLAVGERVQIGAPVAAGAFVRAAGSDVRAGTVLLHAGSPLTAAALGVLAAAGLRSAPVRRRPRILLVVTGHEVRAPGQVLAPGQLHDANSFSLWLALTDAAADVRALPCASDDPRVLRGILDASITDVDLVVTVGGVSAGAREVVRDVLEPEGVWFGTVAMQPGGPQGLGALVTSGVSATPDVEARRVPVLAFPGNPVSCLVSFEVFLRPMLRALATGLPLAACARPSQLLPLGEPWESPRGKHQVRRGTLDQDGRVRAVGGASSHLLHAYARSTVLVHVPADREALQEGDLVETWRIDG